MENNISPVVPGERPKKRIRNESNWKKNIEKNERYVLIKLFMYLINLTSLTFYDYVDINRQCYRYVRHVITIRTNSNASHLQ